MGYSSSLTDLEWTIIEPLLPQKRKTRPANWTKRQIQRWHLLSTQKWLQLGRPAPQLAALLHGVLVLQAVALRGGHRLHPGCASCQGARTSQKKTKVDAVAPD